ncbi:MAG: hypothetical protein JNG84_13020 [Archangium sp.]|nr:hypothetical protein [Archangium sp.]
MVLVACGGGTKPTRCVTNSDCTSGQLCSAGTCTLPIGGTGGGTTGGGTGGGTTGGGTGGGSTGGGTGGGGGSTIDAGTGGGSTDAGTGGGGGSTVDGGTTVSTCTMPEQLTPGSISSTTAGASSTYDFPDVLPCREVVTPGAPDKVYKITVAANSRLSVSVDATWDATLNVVAAPASNCGGALQSDGGPTPPVCVAGADSNGSGVESTFYDNTTNAAVDLFILIDGFDVGESGAFTLTTAVTLIPDGERCENAVALTGTQSLSNQELSSYVSDYLGGLSCASGTTGKDRVYKVTVPNGQRLTAVTTVATGTDGGQPYNATVNLVSGTCGAPLTCLTGSNVQPATALYDNTSGSPVEVFIVIDTSTSINPVGPFALNVTVATIPTLSGETCDNAAPVITTSTTLLNQTFVGYASNYSMTAQLVCAYGDGPDRAYAIDIPSSHSLTVRAIPDGGLPDGGGIDLALSIVESSTQCAAGPCLTGSGTSGTETGTAAGFTDGGIKRVYAVVDSLTLTPGAATFALDVQLLPVSSTPVGDSCTSPSTVISSNFSSTTEAFNGFVNDYGAGATGSGCYSGSGPDRVYRIDVPANNAVTVTATPSASADIVLNLIDVTPASNCTPGSVTCIVGQDDPSSAGGITEVISLNNTTANVRQLYLLVDRYGSLSGNETFSLNVTFTSGNAGETCAAPVVLSGPIVLSGQSTLGYANNVQTTTAAACTGLSNSGRDRVYQVTIPANKTLSAMVTPTGASWDPSIYVVSSPSSTCNTPPTTTACLAGKDNGGQAASDTVTYKNTSTVNTKTVFVVVDSWQNGGSLNEGTFTLSVSFQ